MNSIWIKILFLYLSKNTPFINALFFDYILIYMSLFLKGTVKVSQVETHVLPWRVVVFQRHLAQAILYHEEIEQIEIKFITC